MRMMKCWNCDAVKQLALEQAELDAVVLEGLFAEQGPVLPAEPEVEIAHEKEPVMAEAEVVHLVEPVGVVLPVEAEMEVAPEEEAELAAVEERHVAEPIAAEVQTEADLAVESLTVSAMTEAVEGLMGWERLMGETSADLVVEQAPVESIIADGTVELGTAEVVEVVAGMAAVEGEDADGEVLGTVVGEVATDERVADPTEWFIELVSGKGEVVAANEGLGYAGLFVTADGLWMNDRERVFERARALKQEMELVEGLYDCE